MDIGRLLAYALFIGCGYALGWRGLLALTAIFAIIQIAYRLQKGRWIGD